MNKKKLLLFSTIGLLLLALAGCWDNTDVIKLNMVAAVGIDKADDGQIELTIQMANPAILKAIEQGSMAEPSWTVSSKGYTVFEAVRNMLSTVDQKPYYSHMELIILSEEIARDMIGDVLDLFERDHETRKQVTVLVAKDISAKEILETKCPVGVIPAFHLSEIINNRRAKSTIRELALMDLFKDRNSAGINLVIGTIHTKNTHQIPSTIDDLLIEGGAAYRKDKLVGWLKPLETRAYNFVIDEVQGGVITISNPLEKEKKLSLEIIRVKSKMNVAIKEDKGLLQIDIHIDGVIGLQEGTADLTEEGKIDKIKAEIEKTIEEEVRDIVKLAQLEFKSDIFGFGEIIRRKNLSYWKKVKADWNSEFTKMPLEINVKSVVIRSGLIKNPNKPIR
ncbi:MAG: Ger(x)C family spore germination protein [Peptostreptococcales bacterium]